MFEKEAKKWVRENTRIEHSASFGEIAVEPSAEKGFQKGAEFGYNKANEWHNPKEKLPTKDCEVLIEYDERKTHRVVDWNNKSQRFGGFSIDEVTRWKEIK